MGKFYLAGAALIAFLALGGMYSIQHEKLKSAQKDLAAEIVTRQKAEDERDANALALKTLKEANAAQAASRAAEAARLNQLARSLTNATDTIRSAPNADDRYVYSDGLYSLMREKPAAGDPGKADADVGGN